VDVIIEGFMRRVRQEHDLNDLSTDQLFESFAAYCVIRKFHENDFAPDHFRMGGKGDLGIDAAAVSVNGTLYTDPDALKDAIESHGQLDVHFIIVQARTTPTFSAETFGALGNNLEHVFTETPMTLPCSHLVKRLRACSDVIYGAGAKLHKGLPKLSVYYVAPGNPSSAALDPQRKKSIDRLQKTGWFEHVEMQAVGSTELRALFLQAHDAVKATFDARKYLPLPGMTGVDQAYLAVVDAREFVDKVTRPRPHRPHSPGQRPAASGGVSVSQVGRRRCSRAGREATGPI